MTLTALNFNKRDFYFKAVLLLVLIFGLYLRVGAVINTVIDTPIRADAQLYYLYGLNLKFHQAFSRTLPGEALVHDAFAPPLYPLSIAPFLELPPSDKMLVNIGLAQAVLGTLTVLFTFSFFRMMAGPLAGIAAAALTAISPHLISMTVYMLTETLFIFFMMGGLAAIAFGISRNSMSFALGAGVLFGLAALTRSTLEYFPIFMGLAGGIMFYLRRLEPKYFSQIIIFAATALSIVIAWKIRNFFMTGAFSDPTLAISTLHHGMYPDFMFNGRPESRGIPYRFDPRTIEITKSLGSVLLEIAHRFREAPLQHLQWYLLGKPVSLLSWSDAAGWGDIFVYAPVVSPYFSSAPFQWTRIGMLHTHPILMLLGSLAAIAMILNPRIMRLTGAEAVLGIIVALLVVYFILLHMVGAPFPRYGIPLRPILYGLAVILLFSLVAKVNMRRAIWQGGHE